MRHTEGPWSLDFGDDGAVVYKEGVATIANIPDDLQASSANARLIVEAPALLAALEGIVASMDGIMDAIAWSNIQAGDDDFYALTQARAAIRRARGVSA